MGSVLATKYLSPKSISAASSPGLGPSTTRGSRTLILLSIRDKSSGGSLPARILVLIFGSSTRLPMVHIYCQCYHRCDMIKAVFFDIYGTLAGFSPSRYEIQSSACAEYGIDVTPNGVVKGYADADAYMAHESGIRPLRLRVKEDKDLFFAEYQRRVLKGNNVTVTLKRAMEIFDRIRQIPYSLVPFVDVVPALKKLKERGLILGTISNMDRDGSELIESLGLTSYLEFTVTSCEVNASKPHPKIFQVALEKAGARPEETMHVGDQPESDVEGALCLGIRPVLIDRDDNYPKFERCSRIMDMMQMLPLLDTNFS